MALNLQGLPTTNLQPGQTGAAVQQLQNWLVQNGLMTQAQVNTGYGTYGPQTEAAVNALQKQLGVDNSSGPGYFGPKTIAAIQQSGQTTPPPGGTGTGSGTGTGTTPPAGSYTGNVSVGSTGDTNLDQVQTSITGLANSLLSQGYSIPSDLQITPALVSTFLSYAHQAIDPYSQQLLSNEIDNVNADLQNQQNQYENSAAETKQQFGAQLSSQDNTEGANGVAFSGGRQVLDNNLVNSTNRSLSSLSSTAALNAGNSLRAGAAQVGSANANQFNLPSFNMYSVGTGGQFGTSGVAGGTSLNYNPSSYTVGAIPSQQTGAVNQQEQNYLSQYGTLAGAQSNSGRSIGDLIGMISGLPSGYSVPSNLT